MSPNLSAFLDMITYSEIGPALLAISDDGYNIMVGSTPSKPLFFYSYEAHPRIYNARMNSDAAGRYQLMGRYYAPYRNTLNLSDFAPASQDAIAIQQIRECHAINLIEAGAISRAIKCCAHIWASFPGAGYGQHENKMERLLEAYTKAGGISE